MTCGSAPSYTVGVKMKNLVVTTQIRVLSREGCSLQHLDIVIGRLMPLHLLKLHCSTEGKSTPDHYGAPSTVARRKHLRWDLLAMLVTLEAIRTMKVIVMSWWTGAASQRMKVAGFGSMASWI